MKKNEKIFVVVLLVIAVVAIVFAVNRNNSKDEPTQIAQENVQQTQINSEEQDQTTGEDTPTNEVGKFEQDLGNGVSLNTSDKLGTTKTFDGYEVTDITLSKKGNVTTLLGTVKNTTNSTKPFQLLKITLLDENGEKIQTLSCGIKELDAGESTQLSTTASSNYVNAYDFSISK